MDLFGPRESDPLLQDDPFAPTGTEDGPSDPSEKAEARDVSTPGTEESQNTRLISYSREEATEGPLADLNRALDQGWHLVGVELRQDGSLVFTLRQSRGDSAELEALV